MFSYNYVQRDVKPLLLNFLRLIHVSTITQTWSLDCHCKWGLIKDWKVSYLFISDSLFIKETTHLFIYLFVPVETSGYKIDFWVVSLIKRILLYFYFFIYLFIVYE